jgi:hypothetical protein
MEDAVLDTKSEVLYYDMDTDVVTVFSVLTMKSGWVIGVLTRVDKEMNIIDFKISSPSTGTMQ